MHHRAAAAGLIVAMAATIAACADAGRDTGEAGRPQSDIVVVAEDTRFAPSAFAVEVGHEVTLMLENRDSIEHDLEVEGLDADVIAGGLTPPGDHGGGHDAAGGVAVHTAAYNTESITFVAESPGTYQFYCTIPGHKDAGMSGTLTVR